MKSIILNSGHPMPPISFGTFGMEGDSCLRATLNAISVGYRGIDTASIYNNEQQIGMAIRCSGIKREELFITSKVWNLDEGDKITKDSVMRSLDFLETDYLDSCLIHYPAPQTHNYLKTWEIMCEMLDNKIIKSIGVSNFNQDHIEKIIKFTGIVPSVNQIEYHPRFQQKSLEKFNTNLGIITQSWGPFGQGSYQLASLGEVLDIANRKNKTPHQVVLRWHLDSNRSALPKTKNAKRMIENISIFDFSLTEQEVFLIDQLNLGLRNGPDPKNFN